MGQGDLLVAPTKKDVLIIEDSVSVSILLQEFLKKLGYQNVHICNTGRSGIQAFENLLREEKIPVVFLDYSLPDMNGDDVMTEIFRMKPDVKIIVETANEKTDDSIKNVLRSGAYDFLGKPIRLENLKNIMKILEEEAEIEINNVEIEKQIEDLLKFSGITSLAKISECCNIKREKAMAYLSFLQSKGKVSSLGLIREISCGLCRSTRIQSYFDCPSCKSLNFKHGNLVEHFRCGNVSLEDTYKDDKCPKCQKEIKTIGVDYKVLENYYICSDCENKFAEPLIRYHCIICNSNFKIHEAQWVVTEAFRTVNI